MGSFLHSVIVLNNLDFHGCRLSGNLNNLPFDECVNLSRPTCTGKDHATVEHEMFALICVVPFQL